MPMPNEHANVRYALRHKSEPEQKIGGQNYNNTKPFLLPFYSPAYLRCYQIEVNAYFTQVLLHNSGKGLAAIAIAFLRRQKRVANFVSMILFVPRSE